MTLTICPYYKTGRKCTNEDYCCEKDNTGNTCMSNTYCAMDLEQKFEKIKEVVKTINDDTEHDYECWWYLEQVDKISQIISGVEE